MTYKMKSSQSVDFLSQSSIDLDFIKKEFLRNNEIDTVLRQEVLTNIENVIGSQEIDWIMKNGSKNLVEYIVYRFKFKNFPRKRKLEQFPLHLLLEPSSVCNLRCPMCFQTDSSFHNKDHMGMMDLKLFHSLIDQAVENNCKCLTMASRGEPTLNKDFGKMLKYCKGKFFELKINTNATLLNEQLSYDILHSGVDIVVFSVDSYYKEEYERIRLGGNFEQVMSNIKRFCEIKNSNSDFKKTTARISGVYLGKEQSKEKTFDFWKDIVDVVTFTDAVPRWDTYNNKSMNYNTPCDMLWERMYVWYNGICNPCDFDYKSKLHVGNAKKQSLKDIWSGETYTRYRKMLLNGNRSELNPCNQCNIF